MIDIATAPEHCGDGRYIVASAIGDHRVSLNAEPSLAIWELPSRLQETLKYRAEKLVYVREPGVSFGEFIQLVDTVRPEADIISLITPQLKPLHTPGTALHRRDRAPASARLG